MEGKWRGKWVLVLNISQKNKNECPEMVSTTGCFLKSFLLKSVCLGLFHDNLSHLLLKIQLNVECISV